MGPKAVLRRRAGLLSEIWFPWQSTLFPTGTLSTALGLPVLRGHSGGWRLGPQACCTPDLSFSLDSCVLTSQGSFPWDSLFKSIPGKQEPCTILSLSDNGTHPLRGYRVWCTPVVHTEWWAASRECRSCLISRLVELWFECGP